MFTFIIGLLIQIMALPQSAQAELAEATNADRAPAVAKTAGVSTAAAASALNAKNLRNYPGGRDEEDLKVQEAIVNPSAKIDRRSIEGKVLKINMKKVNSEESESIEQ